MADVAAQGHIYPDESEALTGLRSAELEWRGSPSVLWFRELDGRALDGRLADVYVLGSLLYWMTRGNAVHVHVHGADVLYQRVRGALRRVGPLRAVAARVRRHPAFASQRFR